VAVLDQQSGVRTSGLMLAGQQTRGYDGPSMGKFNPSVVANTTYGDTGGASRFFTQAGWEPDLDGDAGFLYCAKPGKKERNAGLDHLSESGKVVTGQSAPASVSVAARNVQDKSTTAPRANTHPTVKPVAVMAWLIKLLTPPGGVVLDPFLGSGTTAVAAVREGFAFIGCEMEPEYLPILEGRIRHEEGLGRLHALCAR
jgi:site-specific DNA-methyltransferase (adenine-specific)